jgi:hypothetical protein
VLTTEYRVDRRGDADRLGGQRRGVERRGVDAAQGHRVGAPYPEGGQRVGDPGHPAGQLRVGPGAAAAVEYSAVVHADMARTRPEAHEHAEHDRRLAAAERASAAALRHGELPSDAARRVTRADGGAIGEQGDLGASAGASVPAAEQHGPDRPGRHDTNPAPPDTAGCSPTGRSPCVRPAACERDAGESGEVEHERRRATGELGQLGAFGKVVGRIRCRSAGSSTQAKPIVESLIPYGMISASPWRKAPQEYTTLGT